jgi:hypothetical protein
VTPDEIVETVPETDRPMLAGSNVGGEYGDGWHASGIKTRRQNAVDDFVAAGRWLTEAGYTSAARLAANGSSASGALAGIVSLRHGDTFAASTVDYPIADLARADLRRAGAAAPDASHRTQRRTVGGGLRGEHRRAARVPLEDALREVKRRIAFLPVMAFAPRRATALHTAVRTGSDR